MNPMRDQPGSPYGDSTPRSPFSPFSPLSVDDRHRNHADTKTPRSPFSPFSPLSGDERHKSLAESKFQQALASSGQLGTLFFFLANHSYHLSQCVPTYVCVCIIFKCLLFTADPLSPGSMHHGGHKFHEVFQMKQGRYDLQASKISEMMKSSSLDVFSLSC